MTTPTAEQLAPNVDPLLREYIQLCIAEAITKARIESRVNTVRMESLAAALDERLDQIEQFERQVRSHLGVFVPE
jgi:hypothetical protein